MTRLTIAVHGASGTQGGAVARFLSTAGHEVRPLSSRVAADDAGALRAAYDGADAVVASLPLVFSERALAMAAAIPAAVAAAGVPRVVVNPNGPVAPAEIGVPFVDARVRLIAGLREAAPHVTEVRPAAFYMENLVAPWSAQLILRDGVLAYPLPAALPAPWVALDDVAAVMAEALDAAAAPARAVVAGRPLTGPEAAAEIAAVAGRDVRWETITAAAYRELLAPHVGEEAATGVAAAYESPAAPPPVDPAELREGPTRLADVARAAFAVGTPA